MLMPAVFRNEAYVDFSAPENRRRMESALKNVFQGCGRRYACVRGGKKGTKRFFASLNPTHPKEVIGFVPESGREEALEAVTSAQRAFEFWSRTSSERRAMALVRMAFVLRKKKDFFRALLVVEVGKSWGEADADVAEAIDFLEYYARLAVRLSRGAELVRFPKERNEQVYLPLGVGAVIPPWNFPLAILVGMTSAAIVCGNTVVLKPSSLSPVIAAHFMEVCDEADLPPGVVNLLTGPGSLVGDVLVKDPRISFVAFTGSKAVGLGISESAGKTKPGQRAIKRVIAEMGGKNAILVDESADLDSAAQGVAASAFGYQGQKCSACSRAIIHKRVYKKFVERLLEKTNLLRMGPPEELENSLGPVISEESRRKILAYIQIGKREGRLLRGGEVLAREGYFVEPTIFEKIPHSGRLAQEEIFGPVLCLFEAGDFEEGLRLANATEYGLTGAVYSQNRRHLELARREFHVGNLYLNRKCTGALVGVHPFGGFKMSGTDSKAGGPDYLLLFTQPKTISERV